MNFDWKTVPAGSVVAKNGNVYEVGELEKDFRLLRNKLNGNITRAYVGLSEDDSWELLIKRSI